MKLTFSDIALDDSATVTGVRLANRSGQAHLLVSRGTDLSEAAVPRAGTSGPMAWRAAGELGGLPSWDARPVHGQAGVYATLHVRTESAVAWAMLRAPGPVPGSASVDSRLHLDQAAIYEHPRFVKGQDPDQWSVTAVRHAQGVSIPVLFPRGGVGPQGSLEVAIGTYANPIRDALLARVGDELWLFLLIREPGVISNPVPRHLPSGTHMPAILSAVRLDAALQPTSKPVHILGPTPIYEFDVDVTSGANIVLFATTETGAMVAHGGLEPDQALPRNSWQAAKLPVPLVSPSVLILGDSAHFVAIAHLGQPQASIIHAEVALK